MKIQDITIPIKLPIEAQVPERPKAYTTPGRPKRHHEDSAVALSDNAATHPGKDLPAIA